MFWNRRSSHPTDEELSAYLDAELKPLRVAAVKDHLAACEQCSGRLEELSEVRLLLSQLPREEPPRSFALTPQMAGAGPEPPRISSRRSSFVFAPAAALTVLVALLAVDLTSSTSNESGDLSTAAGEQAMVATDASSAGAAEESAGRTMDTFSMPANSGSPQAGQGVMPPTVVSPMTAPQVPAPSANPESRPDSIPPPATGDRPAPSGTPVPAPPSTSGGLDNAPGAAGPRTGDPGAITSQAQPSTAGVGSDDRDGGPLSAAPAGQDDGADWLLIGQIAAAAVFVISTALVFGPALLKKGR